MYLHPLSFIVTNCFDLHEYEINLSDDQFVIYHIEFQIIRRKFYAYNTISHNSITFSLSFNKIYSKLVSLFSFI